MIVGVHPLAGFDKILHYSVPEGLREKATVGSLVRVPVGRTLRLGVVGSLGPPRDFPIDRLKPVAQVVYPFPALTSDLLELARWMASYYAAPLDTVIEAMIPAAVRRGSRAKEQRFLVLARRLTPQERSALERRAPAQARLYAFLEEQIRPQPKGLIVGRAGASAGAAKALVERGIVRETVTRIEREGYADDMARGELVAARPHALNDEQAAAVAAVSAGLAGGGFGVTLLHGVTGSGKTEVYLRVIQAALEAGGGVIFLVPEVALTPQTVARLRSRLESIAPGHRCVVWHSHLGRGGAPRRVAGPGFRRGRGWPSGRARRSSPRCRTCAWSSSTRSTSPRTSRTRRRATMGATSPSCAPGSAAPSACSAPPRPPSRATPMPCPESTRSCA